MVAAGGVNVALAKCGREGSGCQNAGWLRRQLDEAENYAHDDKWIMARELLKSFRIRCSNARAVKDDCTIRLVLTDLSGPRAVLKLSALQTVESSCLVKHVGE